MSGEPSPSPAPGGRRGARARRGGTQPHCSNATAVSAQVGRAVSSEGVVPLSADTGGLSRLGPPADLLIGICDVFRFSALGMMYMCRWYHHCAHQGLVTDDRAMGMGIDRVVAVRRTPYLPRVTFLEIYD